ADPGGHRRTPDRDALPGPLLVHRPGLLAGALDPLDRPRLAAGLRRLLGRALPPGLQEQALRPGPGPRTLREPAACTPLIRPAATRRATPRSARWSSPACC